MATSGVSQEKNLPERFPAQNVIGEIKPHNPAGIKGGIRQLKARLGTQKARPTPQLLTYLALEGTRFAIFIADPFRVRRAIDGDRASIRELTMGGGPGRPLGAPRAHTQIGTLNVKAADELIRRRDCPTELGNLLEHPVRMTYQGFLKREVRPWARSDEDQGSGPKKGDYTNVRLVRKSPRTTGPDFSHEREDFFRELVWELESRW